MGLPFKSVTLQHNGKDYVVQPSDVWGLIGTIETVIGHTKLAVAINDRDIPFTKVAGAYAAALNYAGAKVQPHEVSIGSDAGVIFHHALALFEILNMAFQPAGISAQPNESGELKPVVPAKKKPSVKQRSKSGRAGG